METEPVTNASEADPDAKGEPSAAPMQPGDVSTASRELVVPHVGQLVNLDSADDCAGALGVVKTMRNELGVAERILKDALAGVAERLGSGTMHTAFGKVEVSGGVDKVWDAQRLKRELVAAGMPAERVSQIVVETVELKVAAVELNKATRANPVYAEIARGCLTEHRKPKSVSVS